MIEIEYRTRFDSRCPVDEAKDYYDLVIRSDRMILAETIHNAISEIPTPAYQEHITQLLFDALDDKAELVLTTYGEHSGIATRVECRSS